VPPWIGIAVVLAPAAAALVLALSTLLPTSRLVSNEAALEVLQETLVHMAFYVPAAVVAIFGFVLIETDRETYRFALQALGVTLAVACVGLAYLCAQRRHQLSVLAHAPL
jgi:cytochrome b561